MSLLRGIKAMKKIKNSIKELLQFLSKENRIRLRMLFEVGYLPNLQAPKTFNEKIQHRKINGQSPLFSICADKYAVRQYVKETVGEQFLIPILHHSDTLSESDFKTIDCDAVVKATHDSGKVYFISPSDPSNHSQITKNINKSLTFDFGRLNDEPWYSKIPPSVIIEKKLITLSGEIPPDFKFHVFESNGITEVIIQIDFDRFINHSRTFYDTQGNKLPISNKYKNNHREFPSDVDLPKMTAIAKKLANGFGYVRVDLYNVDGAIYFGELTFAHESGYGAFSDNNVDLQWGNKWGVGCT